MSFIKYIADENHYKEVLSLVSKAKQTVWIGTADIKDLYVDDKPFLAMIASLLKKGVEVRLIHAKEPGTAWREDHEKHPILYDGMERVLCPRVHFKQDHHRLYHCIRRLCKLDWRRDGNEIATKKEL